MPDLDLRILARFDAQEEWVLEPGDLLYLPPGVAHHGVALEPCMTYSIGFRAPSHRELTSAWLEHQVLAIDPELRYTDPPPMCATDDPAQISADALKRVRQILADSLSCDEDALARWFAAFVTESKPGLGAIPPRRALKAQTLARRIRAGVALWPDTACRFAVTGARNGRRYVAVDGHSYAYPDAWHPAVRAFCDGRAVAPEVLLPFLDEPGFAALLAELYRQGAIHTGHAPS